MPPQPPRRPAQEALERLEAKLQAPEEEPAPWWAILLLAASLAGLMGMAVIAAAALTRDAQAQDHTPGAQLGQAIEEGKLPPWITAGSRLELRFHQLRVIACLEDRERTRTWVTWGHWDDYLTYTLTGRWTFRAPEPVPAEYFAMCGFPPPGPPGPVALGEPAYWSIICAGACASGDVAWADMNNAGNLAGTTTQGEPCGPPISSPPAGWYQLPRIQKNGSPAVTRCQEP